MKTIIFRSIFVVLAIGLTGAFIFYKPADNLGNVPPLPTPHHFAELDENGVVLRVIVVEQEVIDTGQFGDPANWVATYKYFSDRQYAGVGMVYDRMDKDFATSTEAMLLKRQERRKQK